MNHEERSNRFSQEQRPNAGGQTPNPSLAGVLATGLQLLGIGSDDIAHRPWLHQPTPEVLVRGGVGW